MTHADALRALLAKVEAGDRGDGLNTSSVFGLEGGSAMNAVDAFDGSLDTAKALHEAVLPEYGWDIDSGCSASVWVLEWTPGKPKRYAVKREYSATDNHSPARAWLIAILKALIATEGE